MTLEHPEFPNASSGEHVTPTPDIVESNTVLAAAPEEKSEPKQKSVSKPRNTVSRLRTSGQTRVRKQSETPAVSTEPKPKGSRTRKYFSEQAEQKSAGKSSEVEASENEEKKFGTHFMAGAVLKPLEKTPQQPAPKTAEEAESRPKPVKEENFEKLSKIYEKKGLGEIATQLGTLPEFQQLPEGQKLLVMQGVSDKLLAHVRREGTKGFRQEYAASGFLKKVWKGMTKNAVQARHEKDALKHAAGEDAAAFVAKVAPGLIKVYGMSGLNAYLRDNGEVQTQYSALDKKYIGDDTYAFNRAATEFSRIPGDWNKPGATWGERRAYAKALKNFNQEKSKYLTDLMQGASKEGIPNPRAYAAEVLLKTETMVKTMRLLSSDPKTLDRLEALGKNPAWLRGFKDAAFERTIGTTAGFASTAVRSARIGVVALTGVGSTIAIAAAPITASVIGGITARARAKKELRESDQLARVGEIQKGKTAHRMSDVSRKISQLSAAQKALTMAQDLESMTNAVIKIKTYADFVETKLELGQVNFGSGSDQFVRQYELMKALQEARVAIAIQTETPWLELAVETYENDPELLRARTSRLGARFQKTTENARREKVRSAMRKGLAYGFIAGSAGAAVRYFGEYMGWFGHHSAAVAEHHTASVSNPIKTVSSTPDTAWKFGGAHSLDGKGKTFDAPISKPEGADMLHHSAASVKFSSKGIQQTLLNFRHSAEFKHLSPDQQKFFEGNVAKISQEIKGFRPGAIDGKESISFSEGSEFGVSADGKVYVADKLTGKTTVLGHFEGASFKADATEADLKYIDTDAKHAAPVVKKVPRAHVERVLPKKNVPLPRIKPVPVSAVESTADSVAKPSLESLRVYPKPVEESVVSPADSVRVETGPLKGANLESLRVRPVPVAAADTVARVIEGTQDTLGASLREYVAGQEFTPRMRVEMDSLSGVVLGQVADRYFSYTSPANPLVTVAGHSSPAWLSFSSRAARDVLATELTTYGTQFRPFVEEVRALSKLFPTVSKEQPLGTYLKKLYRALIEQRIVEKAART